MGGIVGIIEEHSIKQHSARLSPPTSSVTGPQQTHLRRNVVYHPELRKLRLILTCDYGRPKFIKFLFRVVPVCCEILREHQTNVINYISNFEIVDDLPENSRDNSSSSHSVGLPIQLLINGCLTSILVLVGITYFHSFISSPEGEDWVRYQHLLTTNHAVNSRENTNNSMSESTRELSQARSHALVQGVNYDEIIALMNQPLWLLTLARTFDNLPFPITIHGTTQGPTPPATPTAQATATFPLLYANLAYLDMSGYSTKQLIGTEPNFLDVSEKGEALSNGSLLISNTFKSGTKLRLGRRNQRCNHEIFHNYMTFKPLHDVMSNSYKFMIIVHCDVTKRGVDEQYLHKINLFTEIILPSHIFCSELDSSLLSSYFYQAHVEQEQEQEESEG
jgi:hypothetical protein